MEDVIDRVKRLAHETDERGRQQLIDGLRDLSYSIETPDDTLERILNLQLQVATICIGINSQIFNLLAANDGPMALDQLQFKTGIAPTLLGIIHIKNMRLAANSLGRLLRHLASIRMIKETGTDEFTSTNITKALAIPGVQAGVRHQFEMVGRSFQELPDLLAKLEYRDLTDHVNTAFQVVHKTPLSPFAWMAEHPEVAADFNEWLAYHRKDRAICWDVYPIELETRGWDFNATVLVDIGGNIGHQCAEFKKRFPRVPGHVILEDLEGPISMALSTPGVENKVHDIFKPQPIKGAKYYYLRYILHDWPDEKCREILCNIIPAMGPDSIILIDEMVLPNKNVHWQATLVDLTMMACLASVERTFAHWERLLDSVGLRIAELFTYKPSVYECVMSVVRK